MQQVQRCMILIFVLLALLSVAASSQDYDTGLVGYWRFEEGTGTGTTADSSGAGRTGTLVGNPTWEAGQRGMWSLGLNGTSQYVTTAINAGVTPTTPFTLCAWAYSTSNNSYMLIGTAIEADPWDGVWFMWGGGANPSKLGMSLNGGGNATTIEAQTAQTLNTWYHLCGTYDGSQTAAGLKLYRNGSPIATTVTSNTGFSAFPNRPWRIGTDSSATHTDYFAGRLDSVRVYNRALSAADVLALYNATETIPSGGTQPPAYLQTVCTSAAALLTQGDGQCLIPIPADLNGAAITQVSAHLATVTTSGITVVSLERCAALTTGNPCSGTVADVFSTNLTLNASHDGSETASVPAVINTATATVATGQWLRVNVDTAGTGAKGLFVTIKFEKP